MDSTKTVTEAPRVAARLLGPPRIEVDGAGVSVDTRKAVALLAYLVLTGRPQSRDHLAALLWPEADQSRARSALRRTLSALNSAIRGHGLVVEREALAVDPESLDTDVDRFRALVASTTTHGHGPSETCMRCVAPLREAVTAHGGEFLSGFVLRDSPEFDEWQLAAADELRRELGAALERLVAATTADDPDTAIGFAKRWVELDALHEPAHRALMRAFAAKGDRSSALRQYRECVAVLERELGVEPLEETTELYEAIRESRPVERPRRVETAPAQVIGDLPLVGRSEELRSLVDAYDSTALSGRLIVIGGEPGIGKTRLASEFVAVVEARGALVLQARCHPEEEMMAFGTAIELLRSIPVDLRVGPAHALAEVARLAPEFAPGVESPAPLDSPAARRRLFEAVADVITAACDGDAPGVVVVDDAQWMDESTRDVLRFLVHRLRGRRLCVALTWRTEEVPPAHPLRRMLADALRDGIATPLTLQRLTIEDLAELIRSTSASGELVQTLFEETAGVPFFVVEYLKSEASSEPLPSGVRDLLSSRVQSVSRRASQVLTAAAVVGRAFEPQTVRETSGRTADEVAASLEELTASGLIAESDERYDFTHPKLRDYVYDDTTLGRRRLLHGRAAKALARRSRRHPEIAALAAHHFERAGEEEVAAQHFKHAGDHARSVYANAEALAHYQSALALGHPDAAELHEAIGDLHTLGGRYPDAIGAYEKAAALGADITRVAPKLGGVHHRVGDWASAEAHYLEAEEALGDSSGVARVLAERSLNAHRAGDDADAAGLAERALARAGAEGDARSVAQAHNVAGIIASSQKDARRAREHLEASLTIAEKLGDTAARAAALNNLSLALRDEGSTDAALAHAERALELCRTLGDRHREAAVLSNIADVLRSLGRTHEAMERVRASAAILADIGEADQPQPEIWKLIEW